MGISWVRDCKKIQNTQTDETCDRVILWVDFSVGRGSAVGRAHACALARLRRFVLLLLTSKKWRLQSRCNHSTAYVDQWKG